MNIFLWIVMGISLLVIIGGIQYVVD